MKKVLDDFDHVKKGLKVDDEGIIFRIIANIFLCLAYFVLVRFDMLVTWTELKKMESDPTYNINVSGDIKQMLAELGTEKGKKTASLGGGGSKAQQERAAALEAILAARSRIVDDSKSNGKTEIRQGYSIVDAASASVHGRSAAAAKAAPAEKTAARIAAHMAGDIAPVNAKLVSICLVRFSLFFLDF